MLADDVGAQLTSCSAQTEGVSGRTIEQLPPPGTGEDKEGCIGEAVPTPVLQHDEAGSRAADVAVVDSKVEQVIDEEARANTQQEELPRDDPPPEGSNRGGDVAYKTLVP